MDGALESSLLPFQVGPQIPGGSEYPLPNLPAAQIKVKAIMLFSYYCRINEILSRL